MSLVFIHNEHILRHKRAINSQIQRCRKPEFTTHRTPARNIIVCELVTSRYLTASQLIAVATMVFVYESFTSSAVLGALFENGIRTEEGAALVKERKARVETYGGRETVFSPLLTSPPRTSVAPTSRTRQSATQRYQKSPTV